MKKNGRCDVVGLTEAQFEPGSNDLVIKNRLGITSPKVMDDTEALALFHPFRDGNGRVSRILSTLMALQAGLPLLDFGVIAGEKKLRILRQCRQGWITTIS